MMKKLCTTKDWVVKKKKKDEKIVREPVQIVTDVSPNDVLLGRGSAVARHSGNVNFRKLVNAYREEYHIMPRCSKLVVVRKILGHITAMSPPGRFLEVSSKGSSQYQVVTLRRSMEKTSQALREKTGQMVQAEADRKQKQDARKPKPAKTLPAAYGSGLYMPPVPVQGSLQGALPGTHPAQMMQSSAFAVQIPCMYTLPGMQTAQQLPVQQIPLQFAQPSVQQQQQQQQAIPQALPQLAQPQVQAFGRVPVQLQQQQQQQKQYQPPEKPKPAKPSYTVSCKRISLAKKDGVPSRTQTFHKQESVQEHETFVKRGLDKLKVNRQMAELTDLERDAVLNLRNLASSSPPVSKQAEVAVVSPEASVSTIVPSDALPTPAELATPVLPSRKPTALMSAARVSSESSGADSIQAG